MRELDWLKLFLSVLLPCSEKNLKDTDLVLDGHCCGDAFQEDVDAYADKLIDGVRLQMYVGDTLTETIF